MDYHCPTEGFAFLIWRRMSELVFGRVGLRLTFSDLTVASSFLTDPFQHP